VLAGLLAVARRLDVAPAAEEDAVAELERVREADAREREADAAGQRERSLEPDGGVIAEVVLAEREADDGLLVPDGHDWTFLPERP
jgi:hypothetical protein